MEIDIESRFPKWYFLSKRYSDFQDIDFVMINLSALNAHRCRYSRTLLRPQLASLGESEIVVAVVHQSRHLVLQGGKAASTGTFDRNV